MSTDQESGQTIQGTGESHLDDKIDIPKHAYRIDANITAPQVAYRETITRAATVDYTTRSRPGRAGQFTRIKIVAEPLSPGSSFCSKERCTGRNDRSEVVQR